MNIKIAFAWAIASLTLPVFAQTDMQAAKSQSATLPVQETNQQLTPPAKPEELIVPPKPVAPKRCDFAVTLQSDTTFDLNLTTLKADAKKKIDEEVMDKLATCAKLDLVIVTGHTDLIGNHQHNQKLSEKRAEIVAAYLVGKGVTATIDTMGMGKTQQIKACSDKLSHATLIECLAPNRRVVIEGRGIAK